MLIFLGSSSLANVRGRAHSARVVRFCSRAPDFVNRSLRPGPGVVSSVGDVHRAMPGSRHSVLVRARNRRREYAPQSGRLRYRNRTTVDPSSFAFTANGAPAIIRFTDTSIATIDVDAILDNVVVTGPVPPLPVLSSETRLLLLCLLSMAGQHWIGTTRSEIEARCDPD